LSKKISIDDTESVSVRKSNLEEFLGARKFKEEYTDKNDKIGVVTGLAWTRVGGTTLNIETVVMKGKGNFKLTGNVGKVMEESAGAAISYIRANAEKYGIEFLYRDFRVGFREGQAEARELGLYMQKYCGCVFSEEDRYSKQIKRDKESFEN